MHRTYSHVTRTSGWMGALWHTPYYGSLGNLSWSCHDRLCSSCGLRWKWRKLWVPSLGEREREYSSLRHRKTFSNNYSPRFWPQKLLLDIHLNSRCQMEIWTQKNPPGPSVFVCGIVGISFEFLVPLQCSKIWIRVIY